MIFVKHRRLFLMILGHVLSLPYERSGTKSWRPALAFLNQRRTILLSLRFGEVLLVLHILQSAMEQR